MKHPHTPEFPDDLPTDAGRDDKAATLDRQLESRGFRGADTRSENGRIKAAQRIDDRTVSVVNGLGSGTMIPPDIVRAHLRELVPRIRASIRELSAKGIKQILFGLIGELMPVGGIASQWHAWKNESGA